VEEARALAVVAAAPSLWPNVADVFDGTVGLALTGASGDVERGLSVAPDAPKRCLYSSTSPFWQVSHN